MKRWIDRVTSGDPTTIAEYEIVCMRAESISYREHRLHFKELPESLQDRVWEEALIEHGC